VLWPCLFMQHTAQRNRKSQTLLTKREQCRSCCRFCRSAVMYVASDGVGWPLEHRFSATRFSRNPLETIFLYCASGLVRGDDVVHVVLRLKLHMPDLTLSLVTNELSHLTEHPTKVRKPLENPEDHEHCLLTRRGPSTSHPNADWMGDGHQVVPQGKD